MTPTALAVPCPHPAVLVGGQARATKPHCHTYQPLYLPCLTRLPLPHAAPLPPPCHRPTCKPRLVQEQTYSYYYKDDGIKMSGCVSPCGIVEDLYGPIPGIYHDLRAWYESNVARRMDSLPAPPQGGRYVLYGDSAYRVDTTDRYIATACSIRQPTTGGQRRFSQDMNRMRATIEWMFGINYACWELLRKRTLLRLGQTSVGMWYAVAMHLT